MRGKFVVGNWKMNGGLAANAALLAELAAGWTPEPAGRTPESGRRIAVCVPYPYLAQVGAALRGTAIAWGAQDVSEHESGAFTGEVSARMLAEFGCRYVIVGHSERRQFYGDTDAVVAAKAVAALAAGLTPIACVGETLAERDAGATMAVVSRQLDAVLAAVGANAAKTRRRLRAGLGDRHRANGVAGRRAGGARVAARAVGEERCGGRCAVVRRERQGGQREIAVRDGGYRWWPDRRRIAPIGGILGDRARLTRASWSIA